MWVKSDTLWTSYSFFVSPPGFLSSCFSFLVGWLVFLVFGFIPSTPPLFACTTLLKPPACVGVAAASLVVHRDQRFSPLKIYRLRRGHPNPLPLLFLFLFHFYTWFHPCSAVKGRLLPATNPMSLPFSAPPSSSAARVISWSRLCSQGS